MSDSTKDLSFDVKEAQNLTYEQHKELIRASRQNKDVLLAQRASAVLVYYQTGCVISDAIAANKSKGSNFCRFKLEESFMRKAVQRYNNGNKTIESLLDAPRSGRPKSYTEADKIKVVDTFLSKTPSEGWSFWSAKAISETTGLDYDFVCRTLREYELNPNRVDVRCNSNDPKFYEKCEAIIRCYTEPAENERIICVDEKTSIQSLEEKQGFVITSRHDKQRVTKGKSSTYVRHGTTNLLAALDVHSGIVYGEMKRFKDADNFISFISNVIDEVRRVYPNDKIIFVMDNYRVHLSKSFKEFQTSVKFENCSILYTPVSASWINHIERFFSTLTRRILKHNKDFCADIMNSPEYSLLPKKGQKRKDALNELYVQYLEKYIIGFIHHYNKHDAKPYVWRSVKIKNGQLRPISSNMVDTSDYYGSSYELACKSRPALECLNGMFSKSALDDYYQESFPERRQNSA